MPGIVVERDANGEATGRLLGGIGPFNTLVASILPASFDERKDSLENYFTALNESGVTGFIDDSAGPAASYETLFALSDEGRLSLRAGFRVPAQAPGNESAFFESVMAFRAPRERGGPTPFVGMGESVVFGVNDGVRMGPGFQATPEALAELEEVATLAATRRIPLEIHAYTDDAASQILDVFERVDAAHPIGNLRWAMAHLNTGSPETIARMKALGMAFSVQMGPYFEGPAILEANGPEVALRSAARAALDQDLVVAGGTDATRIGDYRVWPAVEFQVTGASLGNAVVRPPRSAHAGWRPCARTRSAPPGSPSTTTTAARWRRASSRTWRFWMLPISACRRRGTAKSARCSRCAAVRPSMTGGAG